MKQTRRTQNPRCFLVYALAPEGLPAAEANQLFNEFVGNRELPLSVFHDHFIGQPGGVAVFYIANPDERDALLDGQFLPGWNVAIHPMIFSRSPSGFDEQIKFTLRAYREEDWASLRSQNRPRYGDPSREAQTAEEDLEGTSGPTV